MVHEESSSGGELGHSVRSYALCRHFIELGASFYEVLLLVSSWTVLAFGQNTSEHERRQSCSRVSSSHRVEICKAT